MNKKTLQRILRRNRNSYRDYTVFRKRICFELAPKESEMIFYLLPWLISVNHPDCPGYLPDLKNPFKVFNVDNDPEIRMREPVFFRRFKISSKKSLLHTTGAFCLIHGLYTIGSIGTVGQTTNSDCDIWVAYDRREFSKENWTQLNQKINYIKDWLDQAIKIPVYFFISDITDIRKNRFGSVDSESSGSTQKNVLKEEFYRTSIVICGKIPLWWAAYDRKNSVRYHQGLDALEDGTYDDYDLIDFGNLKKVENHEYFGAALWQVQKSLTYPLKSIIKMVLLKLMLEASRAMSICHRFRDAVLFCDKKALFPDPTIFTMQAIFMYYDNRDQPDILAFLKQCFYMRCELKPYDKGKTIKRNLSRDFFKKYPMDLSIRSRLSKFCTWDFGEQIALGDKLFEFLVQIYKEIAVQRTGVISRVDKEDLTVLGRKISAKHMKKKNKIPVLNQPIRQLNLTHLTLWHDGKLWHVYAGHNKSLSIVSSPEIIYTIAFIVWNNIFSSARIRMEPNPTSVTLQEVINLGRKLAEFIGIASDVNVEYSRYLKKEYIVKLLGVVSFEKTPWEKTVNDIGIVYKNSWGEIFYLRFSSPESLNLFFKGLGRSRERIDVQYYLQRNTTSYEKIIERAKRIIMSPMSSD